MYQLSPFTIAFLVVNIGLLFLLPRRLALMPLLVSACYMTLGQGIELGLFHFPVLRLLLAAAFLRVLLRGERLEAGIISLDWLMVVWAAWAVCSSFFYDDVYESLIGHLGLVYNTCGIYFIVRLFCQSIEDLEAIAKMTAILLGPVALFMFIEVMTGYNTFSSLGGVPEFSAIREGKIRAQGPFLHPILAGTVGAVCIPLMIGLWRQHRKTALVGLVACMTMVLACASSGPVLSLLAGIAALFMWKFRHQMRFIRWLGIFIYIGLDLVMKAPAYYLIARIDPVGGSTGYHRARLIQSAFEHLSEWWLAGTNYTRHWMETGVSWSPNHTDITNHYIQLGVTGGLALMILFIAILIKAFFYIGEAVQNAGEHDPDNEFFIWTLGASLFAHASACIAVSYFDQSFIFLYVNLAAIASIRSAYRAAEPDAEKLESLGALESPDQNPSHA
jgi:hypothetical protein